MKEIEFNIVPVLSGKIYLDMIIGKGESDLKKYINGTKITASGITGMRMPAFELTGEFGDKVLDLITNYTKESFITYVNTVETSTKIPKFKK